METKQQVRHECFIKICAEGLTDVAEFMLRGGKIDLNYLDREKHSALWYAVHGGHIALTKLLLCQSGIHLDTLNLAIEEAYQQAYPELVQEILDYPNVLSNSPREQLAELIHCCNDLHSFNFDVLTAAIKLRNTELAEKIIDTVDIYIDFNADYTPLVSAIESGNVRLIQKLLTKPEIDINAHGMAELPPLLSAVKSPKVVQWLLQKPKINKRKKDSKGNTALILAVKENVFGTVKLLVESGGINVNAVNKDAFCFLTKESQRNLMEPYNGTATASTDSTFGFMPLFGRRISRGDYLKSGLTALQTAIALGYEDIALYLLEKADVKLDIPFPGHVPLLFVAIQNKMDAVVKALLPRLSIDELNATYPCTNNPRKKMTALHVAFQVRSLSIFQMLLQRPIDVNCGKAFSAFDNAFVDTILGEIFYTHRHKENVYEYLKALMQRSDLNLHIRAYLPSDNRTVFQIMQEEKFDLLLHHPDKQHFIQNGNNGYDWHC